MMTARRSLLVLALTAELATAFRLPQLEHPSVAKFDEYITTHGRQYAANSEEYNVRFASFTQRIAEIEKQNRQPNRRWTAGFTSLSDQTDEEFEALLGWKRTAPAGGTNAARPALRGPVQFLASTNNSAQEQETEIPDAFMKWTKLNTSKRIKNQGACGSCWAVTAATVLDMHNEIYRPGDRRTFSARELVSCVSNPHNCGGQGGCRGATVELAYEWIMEHGLSTELMEPYVPLEGICSRPGSGSSAYPKPGSFLRQQKEASHAGLGLTGWKKLPENQYEPLLRAVVERGPAAVSAGASSWRSYTSGVFDGCSRDVIINHAVVLVGYGYDEKLDSKFYDIQNSWGSRWGEMGHIRLLRADDDATAQCGDDRNPQDGTGCDGGPPSVRVCGMCGVLYDSVIPFMSRM